MLARPAVMARNGFWRVAARSFAVLFIAEFGDLTQLATANLAARYHDPVSVGVGAVLGLWAVGGWPSPAAGSCCGSSRSTGSPAPPRPS